MKKLCYILVIVLTFACDSENANDCIQTSGPIIQQEIDVSDFSRILVNRGVELILKQDAQFKVVIEAGENLINDITVSVEGDQLVLTDNNTCNYVRNYESTKVYVSAPTISEIRSSTQYDITSDGVLSYEVLQLFSEDFFETESYTTGDFRLQLDVEELRILTNNLSSQFISGNAETLNITYAAGAGRFEGENFVVQHIMVNHRGSNDMIINPQQSLTGTLRGTGDVILVNQPPIIEIEQLYTGQLIFN